MGCGADTGVAGPVSQAVAVRYERRADIHEAFLHLGCSLICLNYLLCGASAKFGTLSPAHRRYRRHRTDAGLSGRAVPPAPSPDVGMAMLVPVVDGSRDRLLDLPPGLEEPAGQGERP
jgi:hypothetical protein